MLAEAIKAADWSQPIEIIGVFASIAIIIIMIRNTFFKK